MDASQFSRWTRFAKKGGIGTCVALKNCAAEHPGDLMFFKVLPFLFLSSPFFAHADRKGRRNHRSDAALRRGWPFPSPFFPL